MVRLENRPQGPSRGTGRGARVAAFLLSLIAPGAGHFLLWSIRRGIAWAIGVAAFGLILLFILPVSFFTMAVIAIIGPLMHVASALDTLWVPVVKPRWLILLISWTALFGGNWVLAEPIKSYYGTHYARAFTIPSGAMEPTLLVGDYILTNNSTYRVQDPQRGDIIVFKYPQDESRDFIKRIIGTPGDAIQIRGHQVLLNGKPLEEPYVKPRAPALAHVGQSGHCAYAYGCEITAVPPDSYFVMGDNRDNSQDSRYWGFVRRDKIVGRAFTIYWSWDRVQFWPRLDRVGRSL